MHSMPSPLPTRTGAPRPRVAPPAPDRVGSEAQTAEDEALAALRFTAQLLAATDPLQVARAVVGVVHALGARWATVTVGSSPVPAGAEVAPDGRAATNAGSGPAGPSFTVPLRHRERDLGALLLGGPEGAAASPISEARLDRIATAAAAALARLADAAAWSGGERDELTGMGSRTSLEQLLIAWACTRTAVPVGVVACDLDRFRRVNEGLGRSAGDDLLRLVAERLSTAAGECSTVARLGSDEFVVVLPGIRSASELESRVEALDAALRPPVRLAGRLFYPSASFGSAFLVADPEAAPCSALALLHAAEADMEAAKERRHNHPPKGAASDLLQLEADLHAALERRDLIAHFQPVYDLRSGRLAGFETLARWPHPESGFIPPDVFIALAEDNGMIDAIGMQMLEAAGRFVLDHPDPSVVVYVNVSTKQAARRGFAREVADLFSATPEVLRRLVVELTETAIVLDHRRVEHELRELARLGVVVAIDDFGSGYSSLTQLQDLPVTEVKIDRAFVQRQGAVGEGVLEAMMRLASNLGLSVVGEGVERREQLRMLQALGCHRAQGYLFSPALPADLARALPPTMQELIGP